MITVKGHFRLLGINTINTFKLEAVWVALFSLVVAVNMFFIVLDVVPEVQGPAALCFAQTQF